MIIHLVTSSIFGLNYFSTKKPGAGFSTQAQKVLDNLSLGLSLTTRRFSFYNLENLFRYTKKTNRATQSILIEQLEQFY